MTEIFAYSWATFPETTPKFGAALLEHIQVLARFPYLGRLVPERPGVRMLVHTPIQIYYHLWEDDRVVEILEIRHAARR